MRWSFNPIRAFDDMPYVIARTNKTGASISSIGSAVIASGEGLFLVGSMQQLFGSLYAKKDNIHEKISTENDSNLGILFYHLGLGHAGLRGLGWNLGMPFTIPIAAVSLAYTEAKNSKILPSKVTKMGHVGFEEMDRNTKGEWVGPSFRQTRSKTNKKGEGGAFRYLRRTSRDAILGNVQFGMHSWKAIIVYNRSTLGYVVPQKYLDRGVTNIGKEISFAQLWRLSTTLSDLDED